MKRRGFLKGLVAAVAAVPVVAHERTVAPADVIDPVVIPLDLPPPPDLTPAEREAAEAHWRDVLLEHVKNSPAVQEILERRVIERLQQQYPPMLIRPQPAIFTTDSANWQTGAIYPGTPIEITTPARFVLGDDGAWESGG